MKNRLELTRRYRVQAALCSAALIAVVAFPAVRALAGAKTPEVVTIDSIGRVAQGSFGSTRASGNTIDYIGCWSRINVPLDQDIHDNDQQGGCEAKQYVNPFLTRTISCTFPTAITITNSFTWALGAMTSNSHIKFTWVTIFGQNICQTVQVDNFSHNRPTT